MLILALWRIQTPPLSPKPKARPDSKQNRKNSPHSIPLQVQQKWRFYAGGSIYAPVVVGDGKVFFGTTEGFFFALDLATGKKIWKKDLKAGILAPALYVKDRGEGRIYVGNEEGIFFALQARDGRKIWRFSCGGKICGGAISFYDNKKLRLVFGAYDNQLHCLNEKGKELWKVATKSYINGSAVLTSKALVFGGCDGFLRMVDPKTGIEIHSVDLRSYIPSSPVVEKNTLWVCLYKRKITALKIDSAKIIWTFSGKKVGTFSTPPAVNQSYVVAADQKGRIYILRKNTGKLHLQLTVSARGKAGPIVDKKNLLIGDGDGFLYVFDLKTGREIWRIRHGPAISAPLVVHNRRIYVGDYDGYLTVYE